MWLARTVCYSQLNLTSDRLLSDSMWFLCRFRHIRYVESGSYRNFIDSFCQHFHGKNRNKNTEPKQNKKYGNVSSMTGHLYWDIDKQEIDLFLQQTNSFHPAIKFTAEISDKEITFLDTVAYKGERFQKDAILDIKTHYSVRRLKHFSTDITPPVTHHVSKEVLSKAKLIDF